MDNDNEELGRKILNMAKKVLKTFAVKLLMTLLPIIIVVILLSAIIYLIKLNDGSNKNGNKSNVPNANNQYQKSVTISKDGQINTSKSAQELWDELNENGSNVNQYLDNAQELKRMMNAETITQYLDTRPNPDEPIDWNAIFEDPDSDFNDVESTKVQGIIKLKRTDSSGNITTLKYIDSETLQEYIDNYNDATSLLQAQNIRNEAVQYFTIEQGFSSNFGFGKTIEAGTAIEIPSEYGVGHFYAYMGWQKITSTTSTQYKLREQAGMNFDSEGFGIINGRYVIACTTTFGNVGDYLDAYLEDGTILPCIIGDIKNPSDAGCNMWGHSNGKCIIEFVVDKDTWYSPAHANPGNPSCHPEWKQTLLKIVNGGSYFDNPYFTSDTEQIEEKENISYKLKDAMCWPTTSTEILKEYGGTSKRKGIDISVPSGSEVYACEDGVVEKAAESDTAGYYLVIAHGNGYKSKYKYNSKLTVTAGDTVKKGDVIAISGSTGRAVTSELYFQLFYNDSAVDPQSFKYVDKNGEQVSSDAAVEGIGSEVSNLSSAALNYYAKVVTWSESSSITLSNDSDISNSNQATYNMSTRNINYQQLVKGYTMPFDYLWSFLVVGDGKDFVLELADLAYNSDIEITIFDNTQSITTVRKHEYTEKTKTNTYGKAVVEYGESEDEIEDYKTYEYNKDGEITEESEKNYTVTDTIVNSTVTLDIELTKANSWIADYEQQYTKDGPNTENSSETQEIDDEEYSDDPNETTDEDIKEQVKGFLNQKKIDFRRLHAREYKYIDGYVKDISTKIYNKRINNTIKTDTTTVTTKYISSPAEIKEKTDPNSDEPNFVTLFLKPENYNVRYNILEVAGWLFEMLEDNPNTSEMVDITKYLLYKATDQDFGVTSYDFSEYDPANFAGATDIAGRTIEDRIWLSIVNAGYPKETAAAILASITNESGVKTNKVTYSSETSSEDRLSNDDYTNKINNGDYSKDDFINDNTSYGLVQWSDPNKKSGLYDYLPGRIDDEEGQIKFLIDDLTKAGTETINSLKNATTVDEAITIFYEEYLERTVPSGISAIASNIYTSYETKQFAKAGEFPRYSQSGQSWSSVPYNYKPGGTISSGGCGACALAMAVSGLTGQEITPDIIVIYLNSKNINTVEDGASCAIAVAEKYGLTYEWIDRNDKSKIDNALSQGKACVFSIKRNGIYNGDGHFIMCYKADSNGYYVLESGRSYNQNTPYRYDQVFSSGNQGVFVLGI